MYLELHYEAVIESFFQQMASESESVLVEGEKILKKVGQTASIRVSQIKLHTYV